MAGGRTWTDEELVRLRELAAAGARDKEIAEVLGRSANSIRIKRSREGIRAGISIPLRERLDLVRVVSDTPERTVYASEDSADEPIEDLIERTVKRTRRAVDRAHAQRYALAKIVSDRPIAIAFASDQHFSASAAVDVEQALMDAEAIQQTPGLYVLLGGDGVDNHIKHRAAMVAKSSEPTDEYRLYDHYLRTLGHKVLGVVSGNHDDWTRDTAGVDMVALLASRHRMHYAPDEMVMTIQLVGQDGEVRQSYTAKVRHQYRYNSSLNLGHTVKRMYDMGGDPFDVGVVCHNHEAHIESFDRHGLTRWALRPGSYQVQTSHGRRYGYGPGYPTCPGVVLWPGERRIEAFHDLRGVVEKLSDARGVPLAA